MPTPNLASLLTQQTKAQIYQAGLAIAQSLNLPVTSWQPGDPTRSMYFLEAEILELLEEVVVGFIQSAFLDYAALPINDADGNPLPVSLEWLTILAKQFFNVDIPDATFATTTVTLTNSGGGVYDLAAGDLVLKNSTSGATYHNTTGGHLSGSGGTLTVSVIADEAGSASSAGASEIDTLVTGLLGVTCTNPIAAVGLDVQSPATTIKQCRNKQASLSPNGPAGAYEFVALNSELTGILTITRARAYADSDTGRVLIYVAGPSGLASPGDVAAVQAAILKWATPLCITPFTVSTNAVSVNVNYALWIYASVNQSTAQIEAAVQTALENLYAARPIGGDIIPPATTGIMSASLIRAAIANVFPGKTVEVALNTPSDLIMANSDLAVLGVVTPNIVIVPG